MTGEHIFFIIRAEGNFSNIQSTLHGNKVFPIVPICTCQKKFGTSGIPASIKDKDIKTINLIFTQQYPEQ